MEIKVVLTNAEARALSYVAYDPQQWAENAIKERARLAMDEIFQLEVQRMLSDPSVTEIPADKEQVVLSANIKMAYEREQEQNIIGDEADGTRLPV